MKKIIDVLLIGVFVLAACAPAATPMPEEEGLVVIRAGTGDGGEGLTPHQTIIQNFEDQSPGHHRSVGSSGRS